MRLTHSLLAPALASTTLACAGSMPLPKTFDDAIMPGAIIENFSKPPKLEIVCRQGDSVGKVVVVDPSAPAPPAPDPNDVIVSITNEPDFTSSSSNDVQASLDAGVSQVVAGLKAHGKHVSKITYEAKNVKGFTTSLADERKGRAKRNPACIAQIADEQKERFLELVTKAYRGDVTYSVEFDNSVSADAKLQITRTSRRVLAEALMRRAAPRSWANTLHGSPRARLTAMAVAATNPFVNTASWLRGP